MQLESTLAIAGPHQTVSGGQDAAWIAASQQGDSLAFNRLVLKWEKRVYNIALRMLRHPDEAAEASQEVFLSVYRRHIGRYKMQAKFSTWLYRVTVNNCISRLAENVPWPTSRWTMKLRPVSEHRLAVGGQIRKERTAGARTARADQVRRLQTLSPNQRAVVELKFFQERTLDEIAVILKIPVSTVKSRYYAALDVLKSRLAVLAEDRS